MPREASIVRRCQATIVLALTSPCEDAKIAELVADLSRLPSGHSERGRLAAGMLMALFRGSSVAIESVRHVADLLRIADTAPPTEPSWTQARCLCRAASAVAELGRAAVSPDYPWQATLKAATRPAG